MVNEKKIVVVVGAGASHDAANGTSTPNEMWRPPLASHLFRNNPSVHAHLRNHPGAQTLQATQLDLSQSDELV